MQILSIASAEEKEAYSLGLREIVRVAGDSMRPALHDGDLVLVDLKSEGFAIGDVVYVRHPFKMSVRMIKRIAEITDCGFTLLGDNPSASTDSRTLGLISKSEILGKVTAILR